ncbi:MAG TPA: RtcB family protein [Candidatus Acidoferrales bacterium]|nr:RtcB family protein [Candidatus Acidoferrales bacterium]
MDLSSLSRHSDFEWWIDPAGKMRVPAIIYAGEDLVRDMDEKVREQLTNVATLPGIQRAAYAMPDAHWGYGFPIGGVAAFDPNEGGIISAGGVGFDISCGVRALRTTLTMEELQRNKAELAEALFHGVPAGIGSTGAIHLDEHEMDQMLRGGAQWAIERGYGRPEDLDCIEEKGRASGAKPECVSREAKKRQAHEMGTLGSGNHYLEVQRVAQIFDAAAAEAFGLKQDAIVVSIHCGSRGLGHQVGTDYLKSMVVEGYRPIPDRELACAPIHSELGERYLGAMRAATNCALANRQIITHLVRGAFAQVTPHVSLTLLYDVSHNTCKIERHSTNGETRELFVHRKGATRSFGPGHPELPPGLRDVGQPVLIGGTMGTESYVLVGTQESERLSFSSACHGAGRAMSRTQATKRWQGRKLVEELQEQGVLIRTKSYRGVAEEAPGAYKDVNAVAEAAEHAKLARRVVRLVPLICVKG